MTGGAQWREGHGKAEPGGSGYRQGGRGCCPPGAGEGPGAIPRHRPQHGPHAAPGLGPPAVRGHLCGLRPLCVATCCGSHRTLIRCPPRPTSHPPAAPRQPCPPPPTHPRPLSLAKCFNLSPCGHSPARHGSLRRSLLTRRWQCSLRLRRGSPAPPRRVRAEASEARGASPSAASCWLCGLRPVPFPLWASLPSSAAGDSEQPRMGRRRN